MDRGGQASRAFGAAQTNCAGAGIIRLVVDAGREVGILEDGRMDPADRGASLGGVGETAMARPTARLRHIPPGSRARLGARAAGLGEAMTRDELSDEVRAVMFMLASEAAIDGLDAGMLADAHAGLMALIERYAEDHAGQPAARAARPSRRRGF